MPRGPTSELLLPVHLVEEVLGAQEEVVDLAALLIPLRGVVNAQLGLLGEELANAGHREDDLLHGPVQSDDLGQKAEEALTQLPQKASTQEIGPGLRVSGQV